MLEYNDQYFTDNYFCKDGRINYHKIKRLSNEELEWLNNRYNDSFSLYETLQRIYYHIDKHPKCPTCGNYVPFYGKPNSKLGMFLHHCNYSCAIKDVHYLQDQTKIKRYGSKNNYSKIASTVQKKYNVSNVFNKDDVRRNNIISITSQSAKNKRKETCIKRYGVDVASKSEIVKSKINWAIQKDKEYNTKKKNHTFNTSNLEIQSHNILKEKYPDVICQYRDKDRYPFVCDFYISSLDLFIECNYHWTHGGKPYEGTNEDNKIINKWKSKNTQYYNNAINCWIVRDVNKRNTFLKNKLNYKIFYSLDEFNEWIINTKI